MNLPKLVYAILTLFFCSSTVFGQKDKESKNRNLKILLISDLNDSYGSVTYSKELHEVISRMHDIQPDIILCGGDMVAGQKASLSESNLDSMWTAFDQAVLNPIHQLNVPFGFTMGNHDASPNYHLDRKVATNFWKNNKDKVNLSFVDDTYFPYYFSYVKNNVFFISWDASSATIPDEIKYWMQKQLALPIAAKARARLVLGHLPLYAIVASKNKKGEVINDADETLAFLKDNNVDMYISGHQHAYYPATKEKLTLLHAGCLGGGPRQILGHQDAPTKAYAVLELPKRKNIKHLKITAFEPASHRHILLENLPDSVEGFNGKVYKWNNK